MISLYSVLLMKNNKSVTKIKEKHDIQEKSFSFTLLSKDIPIKILKNSIHIY